MSGHDTVNAMDQAERFEALLASGKDSALLAVQPRHAAPRAGEAGAPRATCAAPSSRIQTIRRPGSCSKSLARWRTRQDIAAYRDGIAAAERRGDKQAGKEMAVFLKRLEKGAAS